MTYLIRIGCDDGVAHPAAEQPGIPLFGDRGVGAPHQHRDPEGLHRIGHGEDLRALDRADERQDLVLLDRLVQGVQGAGVSGLVICDQNLERLPVDPARLVDLLLEHPGLVHVVAGLHREVAGDRDADPDPDLPLGGPGRAPVIRIPIIATT